MIEPSTVIQNLRAKLATAMAAAGEAVQAGAVELEVNRNRDLWPDPEGFDSERFLGGEQRHRRDRLDLIGPMPEPVTGVTLRPRSVAMRLTARR